MNWAEMTDVQPKACKIILNSLKKGRVFHAYLFQGERGTGKREIALLLAKSLFCIDKSGEEICNQCHMCKRIDSGNHPDVHWLEPDGNTIKIEQIKNLQKEFTYTGLESNQKVYIIKDADLLTLNAANRILKFLEEPSKKTTAIMLTENSQSIIPTVRSRCQVIDLQPLNPISLQKRLIALGIPESSATLLSALTNNVDEAFALFNDEWFAGARKLMVQLVETTISNSDDVYLFVHNHWVQHFTDRTKQELGMDLLLLAFRDILYFHIDHEDSMVVFSQGDERLERLAMYFSQEKLVTILQQLLQSKRKIKQNVQPVLVMEQLALQMKR